MINSPTISVITPAFNSEKYIGETIESVYNQTFDDWEMILIDDSSTDNTRKIIQEWSEKDNRIKLFSNKSNLGPGPSRNFGVQKSKGRYIAYLDSDDVWVPEKLEIQLEHIKQARCAFVFSSYGTIDESGNNLDRIVKAPKSISYTELLKNTVIGCLTVLVDKNKVSNMYMPATKSRQPLVLWLRILRETGNAMGLDEVLAYYRVRSDSVSSKKLEVAQQVWHVYRNYEKLSLWYSCYNFINYSIHGFLRNRKLKR